MVKKHINKKKQFEVNVDKGMKDGQRIIFRGEANQDINCEPGDLIVVLKQKKHPIFERINDDLYMTEKINITEALCGLKLIINQLDGRDLVLNNQIGQVISTGSSRCIMKEGMPIYKNPFEKGNLYIKFNVEFPENDFTSTEALKKLEALLPPRRKFTLPNNKTVDEVEMITYDESSADSKNSRHTRSNRGNLYRTEMDYEYMDDDDDDDDDQYGAGAERVECATH